MIYLDTSAALSCLLDEPDSGRARKTLARAARDEEKLVASELLRVELARVVVREALDPAPVERLLDAVSVMRLTPEVIDGACAVPHHVKTLDALHLATAVIIDRAVDDLRVFTYDIRMREVAGLLGLTLVE